MFTLSHAEHAIKIKEYINGNKDKIKKAVVVGAGFIGLETAEAFNIKNLEVTVVEKADRIFPTVSENLKSEIYESIEKHGLTLKLNSGVNKIISENNIAKSVQLDNGENLDFDIALFSIGITPNIEFISSELKNRKWKNNCQ